MNQEPFYADIKKINVAHRFILNRKNKCEYPDGRKYYGIIYCIDGEAEYRFSSKKRQAVKPGNILLLSPEAAYSITVKTEFKHYTVNFMIDGEFTAVDFSENGFYLLLPENSELYYHIFKKLISCRKSQKICSEMQTTACLYELLSLIITEIYENTHSSVRYMRLLPAKEYIENNFKKSITVVMLANICDMSPSSFRRLWAEHYSESPLQYRDKIRLQYAKEYLMSGYYTVFEVAEKCGFDDVNYFIRFFKKHIGVPPGKYMKLIK